MNSKSAPEISIVVCTYNRAALLKGALESLVAQDASPALFEVIVVDNNSTDETQSVTASFNGIDSINEAEQGLSAARNAGFRRARGHYVAYLDDDSRADPSWVTRAVKIISEQKPDYFGGPIYPFYTNEKPEWFKDDYETRVHHTETGPLPETCYISGSNMVFRRSILERLNGFLTTLGMRGRVTDYGEEVNLIVRARKAGYENGYYDHQLLIRHHVPPEKMKIGFLFRYHFRCGLKWKDYVEERPKRIASFMAMMFFFCKMCFLIIVGSVWRDRKEFPHYRQYLADKAKLMHLVGKYYSYALL